MLKKTRIGRPLYIEVVLHYVVETERRRTGPINLRPITIIVERSRALGAFWALPSDLLPHASGRGSYAR